MNGTVIPIGTVPMPNQSIIITAAIIADTLRAAMLAAIQKIIVEIIGISSELILSGLQHTQRQVTRQKLKCQKTAFKLKLKGISKNVQV